MDQDWSEKNRQIQTLLGRKDTYQEGIRTLIAFRAELFGQITQIVKTYPREAFDQMPYAGAKGYHSKTLAYSIWHIFRIEDIVANELISGKEQILFLEGYENKIHAPICTTGNELEGEKIAEFSKKLDIDALYSYAKRVMETTNELLLSLPYERLKQKISEADRARLEQCGCVSKEENAIWLIDYWCGKDIRGLIRMPFCRHWIMHIEAMCRIKNKLCQQARKGVNPVAYCGLSCNHCFLGAWCGSCRSKYNTCSNAACSPDGKCPNVECCREKEIDGCYQCDALVECRKGFYSPDNDGAAAAKAQSLFLKKYGTKEFLKTQDNLHKNFQFSKVQEILGQDIWKALQILEENRVEKE